MYRNTSLFYTFVCHLICQISAVKYVKLREKGLVNRKQYCYDNSGYKETIECEKQCLLEKLDVSLQLRQIVPKRFNFAKMLNIIQGEYLIAPFLKWS